VWRDPLKQKTISWKDKLQILGWCGSAGIWMRCDRFSLGIAVLQYHLGFTEINKIV